MVEETPTDNPDNMDFDADQEQEQLFEEIPGTTSFQ